MDIGAVLITLALLVLALPFLSGPFLYQKGKKKKNEQPAAEPGEERQSLLFAVRDLDFDFNTGKIADEDYERLRTQLLVKAASQTPSSEVIQSLPEQTNSSEQMSMSANGRSCPSCKHKLHEEDLYCSSCGTALSRTCSSCGRELDCLANFCHFCGKAVAQLGEARLE